MFWNYLLYAVAGYVLGSILFSYLLPLWFCHVDIIAASLDHNPGTHNAMHLAGVPVGILCLLCDIGKGFLPVFLACRSLDIENWLFALVLVAPVLGHATAPLFRHGGKAIATSFGVLLGLLPHSFAAFLLAGIYLFCVLILRIQPHERCSVCTFTAFGVLMMLLCLYTHHFAVAIGCVCISAVAVWRNLDKESLPAPQADTEEPASEEV